MNLIIAVLPILAIAVANGLVDHRNSTRPSPNDEPDKTPRFDRDTFCPHKDYRSYVKCLQTHRRHEPPQATGRGSPGGSVSCMDDCERESCRHQGTGPCLEVCYDRCLKKTKEIHHRITEYETTCGEGQNCVNPGKSDSAQRPAPIANLTTSIDIRNYVNNTNLILHSNPRTVEEDTRGRGDGKDHGDRDHGERNTTCKGGQAGCERNGIDDGHRGSEPPRAPFPGFQPWYPSPSLTLVPQIQMVPQVTFGLGISPGIGFGSVGGGCAYPSIWLCLPQQQQQQQQLPQVRDCSGCVQPYPYSRGRCDPSC